MQKFAISINLLPEEFIKQQIKTKKFYQIQLIGTVVLLTFIFLSSFTTALTILQNQKLKRVQTEVSAAQTTVTSFGKTELDLLLLKNRLQVVNQLIEVPSKQREIYEKLYKSLPPSIVVSSFSVDSTGNVLTSLVSTDIKILDDFINKLTSENEQYKFVKEVKIETLNRGRDGAFRSTIRINNQ
ncbi:hypothetical protein HYW42_04475 [Candidatus Daviesbacteria bacterium]|nr:hypothetical protein [Candidatus Daviesbacteria bacterium]